MLMYRNDKRVFNVLNSLCNTVQVYNDATKVDFKLSNLCKKNFEPLPTFVTSICRHVDVTKCWLNAVYKH